MLDMPLDVHHVRAQFPALQDDWALFDNAGGSVPCKQVVDAVGAYLSGYGVQLGASYPRSMSAAALVQAGNAAAATLVGCADDEVVLTGSTTMSAYILSRALGPSWRAGDNVIVSDLDHEANIGAWRREAEARGVEIREWRHDPNTRALEVEDLEGLLDERTRLVSFTHCPNVTGSIHDVDAIVARCRKTDALICVDGVAYAPHRCVDVASLDVDFYLVSLYKVFGPHQGLMFGKRRRLLELTSQNHFFIGNDDIPYKLQPGNVTHELAASLPGIVAYLEGLAIHHGDPAETPRARVEAAYARIAAHESRLCAPLLDYLNARDDAAIVGRTTADPSRRVATVAFELTGHCAADVVAHLERARVAARYGDFYARRGIERMGLKHADGVVRVSMAHYNSPEEVSRVIEALDTLPR